MWIEPWTFLLWAVLLLTVPTDWLLAAALAALVHEFSHLSMIYGIGGSVRGICIHPGGVEIRTSILDVWQELLAALAGPVGSLSLVLLSQYWPKLSICGFVQGIFNLIPLYPLDGGRALRCCLQLLLPQTWERVEMWMRRILAVLCMLLTFMMGYMSGLTSVVLMVWAVLLIRLLVRKKPCKHVGFHVQ